MATALPLELPGEDALLEPDDLEEPLPDLEAAARSAASAAALRSASSLARRASSSSLDSAVTNSMDSLHIHRKHILRLLQ